MNEKIEYMDSYFREAYRFDPKKVLLPNSVDPEEIALPYSNKDFLLGAWEMFAEETCPRYCGSEDDAAAIDKWLDEVNRSFEQCNVKVTLRFDLSGTNPCALFWIDVCTPSGRRLRNLARCTMSPQQVTAMVIDFIKRGAPGLNRTAIAPYLADIGFIALNWIDLLDFAQPVLDLFRKGEKLQTIADTIQDDNRVFELFMSGNLATT